LTDIQHFSQLRLGKLFGFPQFLQRQIFCVQTIRLGEDTLAPLRRKLVQFIIQRLAHHFLLSCTARRWSKQSSFYKSAFHSRLALIFNSKTDVSD